MASVYPIRQKLHLSNLPGPEKVVSYFVAPVRLGREYVNAGLVRLSRLTDEVPNVVYNPAEAYAHIYYDPRSRSHVSQNKTDIQKRIENVVTNGRGYTRFDNQSATFKAAYESAASKEKTQSEKKAYVEGHRSTLGRLWRRLIWNPILELCW